MSLKNSKEETRKEEKMLQLIAQNLSENDDELAL